MAYIGRQLVRGTNRVLDDISGSFNGSTATFNLTVDSSASPPGSQNQLWISIGGVFQEPGTDFTVADAQITFTTAPVANLGFWGMIQGDVTDGVAPSDASVSPAKIASTGDFAFPADVRFKDADGSHYVGLQAPTTVSSNLVWTLPAADGSANQYLKTDGSGALSWGSDSATDATKMPLAGGTFTGDVTFDGQTAGRDIVWDRSADNLTFADNAKAVLGTGGDLEIFHDGSHSFIKDTGTGELKIAGSRVRIVNAANTETQLKATEDAGVELYYNNFKSFETHANGITIFGPEGGGGILRLYGDEGDDNADKWDLNANTDGTLLVRNYASGSWSTSLKVTTTNVEVTGGVYCTTDGVANGVQIGAGNDLIIQHNGTDSFIDNNTGDLYIQTTGSGDDVILQSADDIFLKPQGNESGIEVIGDGGVKLFYDNSKKLETTSAGATVTGSANSAVEFKIENTNNTQNAAIAKLTIHGGDAANQGPIIELDRNGAYHQIEEDASGNLDFNDNGTVKFVMQANGGFQIADGDLVIGTNGHGVDFSITSHAAGMTSELLDYYEEGSWTPTVESGGWGISTQSAQYVRIGRCVNITLYTSVSGSGNGDNLILGGLPFTSAANGYSTGVADFGLGGKKGAYIRTYSSDTDMNFYYSSEATGTNRYQIVGTDIGAGYIITGFHYFV